jgi:hypothetical protein
VQLALERGLLLLDLPGQLVVLVAELLQLDEVARSPLEAVPGLDLVAVLRCLAGQASRRGRVVPRARRGQRSL